MELTLLGTGTPHPNPLRADPSQHIQLGSSSVLVDCGSGVARRMVEGGKHPVELDYIFVTHMHSDHTIDLAHLLISGSLGRAADCFSRSLRDGSEGAEMVRRGPTI